MKPVKSTKRGAITTEKILEESCLVSAVSSGNPEEPKTFREAWDHPDVESREKWREAIRKEFRDMLKRGVWRHVNRKDIPSGRRLIGCKWVFKIKRNGIFRARLVALGYSQIPGVDFTDNFAPVVNDVTYRVILTRMLIEGWKSRIVDVETAFLYGDLEEEIYMETAEGYKEFGGTIEDDECFLLIRSIYGLVQAARQFWKKFVKSLEEKGFETSQADPCLLYRKNQNGTCIIIMYVDDMLIIGDDDAVEETTKEISENFLVKVEDNLADYLGCEFKISEDKKRGWLGQPHIVKTLEKKFGEMVEDMKTYVTPGTPTLSLIKPEDDSGKLSEEEQKIYRSGTGTLLYLVKHSRPDIANPVRELSKAMDGASHAHMKEMKRIIKNVLDTKEHGLKFKPTMNEEWNLRGFCDSDFATDKEKRLSVTGYVIYFMGVPVAWKSRAQRSVVLSSTEAEYVALSEVVKEIKFVMQILQSIKIEVRTPITVHVDNVGAIFWQITK